MPVGPSHRGGPRDLDVVQRLVVSWHGAVVDVVTLPDVGEGEHLLRSGARLRMRFDDGVLLVRVDDDPWSPLPAGALRALPCGQTIACVEGAKAPLAKSALTVDARLFHTVMVATALQICCVAAMLLQPKVVFDDEAGGGARNTWTARVGAPGGAAPTIGAPRFALTGRAPEEAERDLEGNGARPRPDPGLAHVLRALTDDARPGDPGTPLREAIGELARSTARAPDAGAGFGGMLPERTLAQGPGTGTIGVGLSTTDALIRKNARDDVLTREVRVERTEPLTYGEGRLLDVPAAEVELDAALLLPGARDVLGDAARQRQNVIRSCYETWALPLDPHTSGRIVVEVTLRPDGRVEAPKVKASNKQLERTAGCIEKVAADWYLGDGLVRRPTRLSFPFNVRPAGA
jgi:hypothetical protein